MSSIKIKFPLHLNGSIILAQTINTATTAYRNRNSSTNVTDPEKAESEMAPQDYLKAKLSACYAKTSDSITNRLPAVATAVSDRVVLACRQPLTISKSLVDADNAFRRISKSELFVLSIVAFCLWYTATSILQLFVLAVLSLHALPNKIQSARGVWHDGLVRLLQAILDLGYMFITLVLCILMIVALAGYAKAATAKTQPDPPAPVSQAETGIQLPLTGGHFRKPPGARYVEAATSPVTTENQENIPAPRVYPSPVPETTNGNGSRRGSTSSICGKPAHYCREQTRQFEDLLRADETTDAEKRRELAAVKLSDRSKGREIERLGIELAKSSQEKSQASDELNDAKAEVTRVTDMLIVSEELAGPESKELFDKLHADVATANQKVADEKKKHQVLLDDTAAYRTHIENEIEFCQHASSVIAEKLTGKLLLARAEAREVIFTKRALEEWQRKHAEVSRMHHHAMKRVEDAEARREDCYGRMVKAEERMREMEARG